MTQPPGRRSFLIALLLCLVFVPVNVCLSVFVVNWRYGPQPGAPGDTDRGGMRREPSQAPESVAVLPFDIECPRGSPTDELKEAVSSIAENLAIALEKNTRLRVIGLDKVVSAGTKDAMKVGRAVRASAVLRGSVTISLLSAFNEPREKLTASVTLIEVETGYVLWEKNLLLFDNTTPGQNAEGSLLLRLPRIQDEVVRELARRWPRQ